MYLFVPIDYNDDFIMNLPMTAILDYTEKCVMFLLYLSEVGTITSDNINL
jgi:hypothetical protein